MTQFNKYQHLERFGTSETEGILDGLVYIFPKLDGTNASVWLKEDGTLGFGSRNRELSVDADNAGFMNSLKNDERLVNFFNKYPTLRLYGEWLVPHTLKTYTQDSWRKFYVFDVVISDTDEYLSYNGYKEYLDEFSIDYIPLICTAERADAELLLNVLEKSNFLIQDGSAGEGIVVKNYNYKNKHGRQTWAKLISAEFKTQHTKVMGAPHILGTKMVEHEIVEEFITESFVLKEKAKIEVESNGWESKYIPRLLGTIFHELIREEMWNITKKYKNPKIDFSLLNKLAIDKTKKVIGL